jgi:hypothetical protein
MVSFTSLPLTPGNRAPVTHWLIGLVGPIACLDAMEKRKSLAPAGHPVFSLVAMPTELTRLHKFRVLINVAVFLELFKLLRLLGIFNEVCFYSFVFKFQGGVIIVPLYNQIIMILPEVMKTLCQ